MRLLIFGGAGFIGRALSLKALERGHEVVCLSRERIDLGGKYQWVGWSLEDKLDSNVLEGADAAIHLAHDFQGESGAIRTVSGTLQCVEELSQVGVNRQLFVSSYTASDRAISRYGMVKRKLERRLQAIDSVVIVRPGLVIGGGGIFGKMQTWSNLLPILPLPDGGRGHVPIIDIDMLVDTLVDLCAEERPLKENNLFQHELVCLRQIVLDRCERRVPPLILPVPSRLMLIALTVAEFLRIPLPVSRDNLLGFMGNQESPHISTLE